MQNFGDNFIVLKHQ